MSMLTGAVLHILGGVCRRERRIESSSSFFWCHLRGNLYWWPAILELSSEQHIQPKPETVALSSGQRIQPKP